MYQIVIDHQGHNRENKTVRRLDVVEDRWIAERIIKQIAAPWKSLYGKFTARVGRIEFRAENWECAVYIEKIEE